MDSAQEVELEAGLRIRTVTAPYFIATKLEAFRGRGRGDFTSSHDMEDLLTVIDGLLVGFEGKFTTEKWAKNKKISHDSALRDIQSLIEKGILKQDAGRTKGAAYSLAPDGKSI